MSFSVSRLTSSGWEVMTVIDSVGRSRSAGSAASKANDLIASADGCDRFLAAGAAAASSLGPALDDRFSIACAATGAVLSGVSPGCCCRPGRAMPLPCAVARTSSVHAGTDENEGSSELW